MGCWEGDLKNPGDYVVTDLKGESIVLTRDEERRRQRVLQRLLAPR